FPSLVITSSFVLPIKYQLGLKLDSSHRVCSTTSGQHWFSVMNNNRRQRQRRQSTTTATTAMMMMVWKSRRWMKRMMTELRPSTTERCVVFLFICHSSFTVFLSPFVCFTESFACQQTFTVIPHSNVPY